MKTPANLRVSTTRQDVQGQRLAILEYARKHNLQIDEFVEATASAVPSPKRRRLDDLMNVLEVGDCLVVSVLSRLGRSLGQVVAMLDTLAREGVAFIAIKEQIRIEGKPDEIRHFLRLGVSKNAIAKITGVSRPTLYHLINPRNLQPGHSRAFARESG